MTHEFKPKISLSEDLFPSLTFRNSTDNGTPCEVFRNNTTAVEVIIKEVPNNKKKPSAAPNLQNITIKRLEGEIDILRYELKQSNASIEKSRKRFKAVLTDIKKQLDTANDRELDTRSKNLVLQLENEKLQCLLESKTNLVDKFMKELNNLKRVIKLVIKGMCFTPEVTENVTYTSDLEYDDFENDLKRNVKMKLVSKLFDGTATFDINASKEAKNSFDKRPR